MISPVAIPKEYVLGPPLCKNDLSDKVVTMATLSQRPNASASGVLAADVSDNVCIARGTPIYIYCPDGARAKFRRGKGTFEWNLGPAYLSLLDKLIPACRKAPVLSPADLELFPPPPQRHRHA